MKKTLAAILTALLLMSALVGCGTSKGVSAGKAWASSGDAWASYGDAYVSAADALFRG